MYADIAKFLDASPEWVENWLSHQRLLVGGRPRPNPFQVHEIARNIMYHLDQLAEQNYWSASIACTNNSKELYQAIDKYRGTNPALTDGLYKKCYDLADKKREAFAHQVEIERIILQGGFAYKKEEKDRILYHIRMLADGLDPAEIPSSLEDDDSIDWQSDYWGDEDPDTDTDMD
jgi:hypothetical protein